MATENLADISAKYFMNFNFWGCLFNFYIMIFLICYSAKSSSDLDGEVIAAITVYVSRAGISCWEPDASNQYLDLLSSACSRS